MLALIGVMRALNRHQVREFTSDRKPHHWGKRNTGEGSMTVFDRISRKEAEAASMNWSRYFDGPIALPEGGELRTLLDAGRYVDKTTPQHGTNARSGRW
jgi:hypothetical protein